MSFNWASLTNPEAPAQVAPVVASPVPNASGSTGSTGGGWHGRIQGRYENAITDDENRRNWWNVDFLSAKAANSWQVRRTLRMRSRHEVSNNPYLFGICNNNADDLIGSGPTLQLRTPDESYNRAVESLWREWCDEVGYVEKLRTSKLAKTVDGEGFLVLKNVEDLEHPVKLYPADLEADQVTTPAPRNAAEYWVDGITLHPVTGRPVSYTVLRNHPGDYFFPDLNPMSAAVVPARNVVHWFPKFRPGQARGIPVFTPSLDLFSELRAYRRAVLGAAELAADFAAVLEQDRETGAQDTSDDTDEEFEAFRRVPIDRKMMTTLPPGARMSQFKPEHPTTSYEQFQEKCLGEAVRPLAYPLNLALGSSQKFNFSSSKLDHTNYRNALTNERTDCERVCLTPTFREWYTEGVLAGAIRAYNGRAIPPHEWHWPGFESLDPTVDAQADHERLSNKTLSYREFWARRGVDWRDAFNQLSEEQKEVERLKLEIGQPATKSVSENSDAPGPGKPKKPGAPPVKPDTAEAGRHHQIEAFDEGKIKRDADGKFSATGSSKDSAASLADRAKGAASAVKKLGAKVVAAARAVAEKAKEIAYNATWATMKAGVHADDILETAHDYSKIVNDKAMNAEIASHLGIPLNSAVQNTITKVAAFGIVKVKHWLAKRREGASAKTAATYTITGAADALAPEDRAKYAAEVLGHILTELGVSKGNLPTAADVLRVTGNKDAAKSRGEAALVS